MIDLTKPIRSKGTKKPATLKLLINDGQPVLEEIRMDQLDRFYENIPEPRKPREWRCFMEAKDC